MSLKRTSSPQGSGLPHEGLASSGGWPRTGGPPPARRAGVVLAGVLAVGLALVVAVPFRVAVAPAYGEAYLFGYSNRTGIALAMAVFAVIGGLSWWGVLQFRVLEREAAAGGEQGAGTLTGGVLAAVLGVEGVVCAGLYGLTRSGQGFGEAIYILNRVGLLAQGLRPYRDFEFVYGPLQLYGPYFAARLLHLSLTEGYFLVWWMSALAGLAMLWGAIRLLALPAAGKRASFLVMASLLGTSALSAGLNYNPLRYAAPFFCLMLVDWLARGSGGRRAAVVLASFGGAEVLLLGLSPEEGLVFALAVPIYLVVGLVMGQGLRGERWGSVLAALVGVSGGVLLVASRMGVFETMKQFQAGAFGLPILPGPQIVVLFGAMAIVVVAVVGGLVRRRAWDVAGLLLLYGCGMLPAALGRCDWIHVIGYEAGVIVCALLLVWDEVWVRRLSLTLMVVPFAIFGVQLVTGVIASMVKVQLYPMLAGGEPSGGVAAWVVARSERSLAGVMGTTAAERKMARVRAVARLRTEDPHVWFRTASPVLYAPFGYSPKRLGSVQSPAIREGRFMGVLNVLTQAQVEEKIAEMRDHPEDDLLLSPDGMEQCLPARGDRASLRRFFLLPMSPRPRHTFTLTEPICAFIESHYEVVVAATPETGDYGVWRVVGR